ncbi:MAG: phage tail protein [Spirochaetes bacterium]|nr:phage tail protein [Spirochaetota bacterium]
MSIVRRITFPDLKGSRVFTALRFLEHHGFKNIRYKYIEHSADRNIVLDQNIEPGDDTGTEREVILTLSAANPIKHLPSIFQTKDDKSGGFLRRYLWIFYSLLNNVNITLDNIHHYFNPMESPKDFFPWLVSWFSDYYKYDVPEETLRVIIKNIVPLYRWRGTVAGMSKLLEIVVGVRPNIIENYKPVGEYIIADGMVVENTILHGENTNSFFTVQFPVGVDEFTPVQVQLIHDIIKNEKPAHTAYYLTFAKDASVPARDYAVIGEDSIF